MSTLLTATISRALFPHWNKKLPKHVREGAWKYRAVYFGVNVLILFWIFHLPRTGLWIEPIHYLSPDDTEADTNFLVPFTLVIFMSWISFISIQGSDPGFLDEKNLKKAGFDAMTGASTHRSGAPLATRSNEATSEREINPFEESKSDPPISPTDGVELTSLGFLNSASTGRGGVRTAAGDVVDDDDGEYERRALVEDTFDYDDDGVDESDSVRGGVRRPDAAQARARLELPYLPLRARWCRRSRMFVAKYDHYCTVIGTCIGERNHCRFWWFLLLQSFASGCGIGIALTGFQYRLSWWNWMWENGQHIACSFLLWVVFLGVLSMWGFHTFLACSNMTSYELNRGSRVDYLANFDECDLPFSKGLCRNLQFFCCISPALGKAEWAPVIWPPPGRFNRNSRDCCNNIWENRYWRCC